MYDVLAEFCAIPVEGANEYISALCIALTLIFCVMLVDFLARILSRFIPRWNRNS